LPTDSYQIAKELTSNLLVPCRIQAYNAKPHQSEAGQTDKGDTQASGAKQPEAKIDRTCQGCNASSCDFQADQEDHFDSVGEVCQIREHHIEASS
jgi:hypothetical protein